MESTTFNDLNLKINYPYLFCHQGDCNHIFSISSIKYLFINFRFVGKSKLNIEEYPKITFQALMEANKCSVCQVNRARYELNFIIE